MTPPKIFFSLVLGSVGSVSLPESLTESVPPFSTLLPPFFSFAYFSLMPSTEVSVWEEVKPVKPLVPTKSIIG